MKVNQAGIELIKSFEGCRLVAYLDTLAKPPVWTIGYGHTSYAGPPKVYKGMRITEEEAEEILKRDLERFSEKVKRYITVELNDNQFSALVSFAYNVGIGNFRRSSVLKAVNAGRFDEVPAKLMKWVYAGGKPRKGLKRRRKAEGRLFMTPVEKQPKEPLTTLEKAEEFLGEISLFKGEVVARLRLREGPSTKDDIIAVMPIGDYVIILDEKDGWYKVMWRKHIGWAYGKYIKLIEEFDT